MIRIQSRKPGFRRCGIAHPKEPVEYSNDHFIEDEVAILEAEPVLIVTHHEDEPAEVTLEDLVAAIDTLDKLDPANWTKDKGPKTEILEKATGGKVSAIDRDEAWAEFTKGAE